MVVELLKMTSIIRAITTGTDLFIVNHKNTSTISGTCSKLTLKTASMKFNWLIAWFQSNLFHNFRLPKSSRSVFQNTCIGSICKKLIIRNLMVACKTFYFTSATPILHYKQQVQIYSMALWNMMVLATLDSE